jgi:hypothetical protein
MLDDPVSTGLPDRHRRRRLFRGSVAAHDDHATGSCTSSRTIDPTIEFSPQTAAR